MFHYSIVFNSCCSKLRHYLLSRLLDGAHNGGLRSFCWDNGGRRNEREKNYCRCKGKKKKEQQKHSGEKKVQRRGATWMAFVTCNGVHRWTIQKNTYSRLVPLLRTIVPSNEHYHGRRLWSGVVLSMRHAPPNLNDSRTRGKIAWLLSRRLTFEYF